ncbi:MAG: hypothetical protein FWC22_08480 [Treponema sp.]|nr:hypothetical protein [Treponema sp.]
MKKKCVITIYGHGSTIEKFTVKLMADYDIEYYCETLNSLKLASGAGRDNSPAAEETWVHAKCISENAQYTMEDLLPLKFDKILKLHDASVQKVLRETDSRNLAIALKDAAPQLHDKIFRNMSKRAVSMLKEEMKYMGPLPKEQTAKAQENILNTIRYFMYTGEIIKE